MRTAGNGFPPVRLGETDVRGHRGNIVVWLVEAVGMRGATAAEIANLRRRYLYMATSIFFLDLAITVIFMVLSDAWGNAPAYGGRGRDPVAGLQLDDLQPIVRADRGYLENRRCLSSIQRRLTQLPVLSAARIHGIMAFVVWSFRLPPFHGGLKASGSRPPSPTSPRRFDLVLTIFYFTYTCCVIRAYHPTLCAFIFDRYGENLDVSFFGSYRQKLLVALLVISIGPLALIMAKLYSNEGDRLHSEILVDVGSAVK